MAQDSWPSPAHSSRNVTDSEYEAIAARFSDDGIDGTPLDAAVVTAGPGLSVTIRADAVASVRGHAWTSGATTVNLAVTANSSGSTRVDWVVLRLDRADWTVRAVLREGTPGSGSPAIVQDAGDTGVWEIPLALVTIADGASTVSVVDRPQFLGSRIRPANDGAVPGHTRLGEIQYRPNNGKWRGWNGSEFVTIYEDTGILALGPGFSTWEAFSDNVCRLRSGVAWVRVSVRRIGSTLLASDSDGSKIGSVPATLRPTTHWNHFAGRFTSSGGVGRVEVRTDGEIWVRYLTENVTVGRVLELTMTYLP